MNWTNCAECNDNEESENETEKMNLLDLPECVVLKILSYTDHDFLRHVASKVSIAFRQLARSQILWTKATLSYSSYNCWDDAPCENFISDLNVTPYLHQLDISINYDDDNNIDVLLMALMKTRCKIYRLSLYVEGYFPELQLMLQRHPEIKELVLSEPSESNVFFTDEISSSIMTTVGFLVPRLNLLDLSESPLRVNAGIGHLIHGLSLQIRRGGEELPASSLLSLPLPSENSHIIPAGSEPFFEDSADSTGVLDLRDLVLEDKREGLKRLHVLPILPGNTVHLSPVAGSLADLIRLQKHSLTEVHVVCLPEVLTALSETERIEVLHIALLGDAERVCSMFKTLSRNGGARRLRHVKVLLRDPADTAARLGALIETLGRVSLPVLDTLELEWDLAGEPSPRTSFPGFSPFAGLLQGSVNDPPSLREIRITNLSPLGRVELEQLLRLGPLCTPPRTLPLRRLHLAGCKCSESRSWDGCRDRADQRVREVLPQLDVQEEVDYASDGRDVGFALMLSCDCDRRAPRRA